jgi:hypothetical protein
MVVNAHLPPLLPGRVHERLEVYRLSGPGHGSMAPSEPGAARRLRSKVAGGNRVPT